MNNQLAVTKQDSNEMALVSVESQRAIQEVQAGMVIAKKFPRNQMDALERIIQSCTREGLAQKALYQYAKGGSDITGPSIRLAEAIAQSWGNMDFGIKELEQANGSSTVMAYAWDLETNTRQQKVFQVPHQRKAYGKIKKLDDPREVYELIANQGARRLRACLLGIIPADVVEDAVKQCQKTLSTNIVIDDNSIKKMLNKFSEFGVTKGMIEKRIQRRVENITPALMVNMKSIYNSLADGMSKAADWFDKEEEQKKPKAEVKPKAEKKVAKTKQPEEKEETPKADPEQKEKKLPKWYTDNYGMLETMDVAGLEDFRDNELPKLKGKMMDSRLALLGAHIETLIHDKNV